MTPHNHTPILPGSTIGILGGGQLGRMMAIAASAWAIASPCWTRRRTAARHLCRAAIANLLGDLWAAGEPDCERALAMPDVKLHLYGKAEARLTRGG